MAELAASKTSAAGGRPNEFEKAQQQRALQTAVKQGDYVASCLAWARMPNNLILAGVAELADAPDLGSGVNRRGGSSPFARTK